MVSNTAGAVEKVYRISVIPTTQLAAAPYRGVGKYRALRHRQIIEWVMVLHHGVQLRRRQSSHCRHCSSGALVVRQAHRGGATPCPRATSISCGYGMSLSLQVNRGAANKWKCFKLVYRTSREARKQTKADGLLLRYVRLASNLQNNDEIDLHPWICPTEVSPTRPEYISV